MLIKLLKSQKPVILILLPLIFIFFWFKLFNNISIIDFQVTENSMPLYKLSHYLLSENKLILLLIIAVFIIIQTIYLNRINTKHIIIEGRSYTISIIYLILVSSLNIYFTIHPVFFVLLFVLIAIDILLNLNKIEKAVSQIFNIGIIIGVSSLFCFETTYLLFPFWISLYILRSFNFREWIIINLGFCLPHLFTFVYFFFFNNNLDYLNFFTHNFIINTKLVLKLNIEFYLFICSFSIITIISLIHYISKSYGYKISSIKYFNILIVFLITGYFIFGMTQDSILIVFLIIPLSVLLSNYILAKKKSMFKEILILLFFLILFIINLSFIF